MAVRLEKDWLPLSSSALTGMPAQLGVYQIATSAEEVIYIGYAGGRTLWGLRGKLQEELAELGDGHLFRIEITQQYLSRWEELLKIHKGDNGRVPSGNETHRPRRIGQLSPG